SEKQCPTGSASYSDQTGQYCYYPEATGTSPRQVVAVRASQGVEYLKIERKGKPTANLPLQAVQGRIDLYALNLRPKDMRDYDVACPAKALPYSDHEHEKLLRLIASSNGEPPYYFWGPDPNRGGRFCTKARLFAAAAQ